MKFFPRTILILAAVLCCASGFSFAQTVAQTGGIELSNQAVDSGNTSGDYLIGSGDVLDIRVYNRPQLSRETVRVDGQGMIRMPLLKDPIRAVCRSDSELAEAISKLYEEYLRYPHVEVFIKEFQSKPVTVFGAIREPGRFQIQRPIRLLELLSLAGGPTENAGGKVQIRHDLNVRPCAEPGMETADGSPETMEEDTGAVEWVELGDLLSSVGPDDKNNPFVRPGDIVNLIEADTVYVIGNVHKPTAIALKERVTLTKALAIAGGVMEDTNLDRIRVSRESADGGTRIELVLDLKAINKKEAEDIVLRPNDIVEVSTSRSKKFMRGLMESIAPGILRLPVRVIP